jgi:hypothetical protein
MPKTSTSWNDTQIRQVIRCFVAVADDKNDLGFLPPADQIPDLTEPQVESNQSDILFITAEGTTNRVIGRES